MPCPTTVLTGFLGSGKTTLLNRVLMGATGKRIAVIINEFGEISIDHQLVTSVDEEIIALNNGCLCCTVRGDLIRSVDDLFARHEGIDHVVIETTGLADPGPVIQSFVVDDRMRDRLTLDAVVTTVDCRHIWQQLQHHEAEEQIAFADVILLNKRDLVTPEDLDRVDSKVRTINRFGRIHRTEQGDIDLACILGIDAFNIKNLLAIDPGLLEEETHEHDATIGSIAFTRPGSVDGAKFNRWMFDLARERGPDLLRYKGILDMDGEPRRFVFQGVHMIVEGRPGKPWRPKEPRRNELVFIGRNLSRRSLEQGFEACVS